MSKVYRLELFTDNKEVGYGIFSTYEKAEAATIEHTALEREKHGPGYNEPWISIREIDIDGPIFIYGGQS